MAIQFARVEYVSRSTGGNACRKAAYNQRSSIKCERTGELFTPKNKNDLSYHEILLPEGVSEKFRDSKYLWNAVEKAEKRKDSQVAKESVIALPDNKEITHEDKIEISKRYANAMFVSKGLAAQINIHAPHEGEKNWHAHVLATTRGFTEEGLSLSPYKARDTDPIIKKGYIQKEVTPDELYAEIQNEFFKEKGLDLRVDPTGLVSQIHIGPVRMRKHMGDALERANLLREANEEAIRNPRDILQKLTEKQSTFTEQDLNRLLSKHLDKEDIADIKNKVLSSPDLVRLHDKETGNETTNWTTRTVGSEEEKLLRFARAVNAKGAKSVDFAYANQTIESSTLLPEQRGAVKFAIDPSKGFAIIEGRAGTGKSFTMGYIREIYENSDCRVIGLAPTNQVVQDMAKDGFNESLTVHSFLFKAKNGRMPMDRNTVLIVDEAAMLGNSTMVELLNCAKNNGLKVVLFGDDRQLSSVERGGMFSELISTFGSKELTEVRRQSGWHKQVSELLSNSQSRQAVKLLQRNDAIRLSANKEGSLKQLVEDWAIDSKRDPQQQRLILASRNVDVDTLNKAIRDIRLERGEISPVGYSCQTARGRETFAVNDRICLTITDKDLGLFNGSSGTIKALDEKSCTIELDGGQTASFDPSKYHGLKLGYATTVYKSQGKSIPDIYSLHDPQANNKLNYVALTRHKESLKVYVNQNETKSLDHFASQLSRSRDKVSSLQFLTADEVAASRSIPEGFIGEVKKVLQDATKTTREFFSDTFHSNKAFYQYSGSSRIQGRTPVIKVEEEAQAKNVIEPSGSSSLQKYAITPEENTLSPTSINEASDKKQTIKEMLAELEKTYKGMPWEDIVAKIEREQDDREMRKATGRGIDEFEQAMEKQSDTTSSMDKKSQKETLESPNLETSEIKKENTLTSSLERAPTKQKTLKEMLAEMEDTYKGMSWEQAVAKLEREQDDREMRKATGKGIEEFEQAMEKQFGAISTNAGDPQSPHKDEQHFTSQITQVPDSRHEEITNAIRDANIDSAPSFHSNQPASEKTPATQANDFIKAYYDYKQMVAENKITPDQKVEFEKKAIALTQNTEAFKWLKSVAPEIGKELDQLKKPHELDKTKPFEFQR